MNNRRFSLKFGQHEAGENSIIKLRRGEIVIFPWPVIQSTRFYEFFGSLKARLEKQPVTHKSASEFLRVLKMLMAKLKVRAHNACPIELVSEILFRLAIGVLWIVGTDHETWWLILRTPVRKPCGTTCPRSHPLRCYSTGFWMLRPRNWFRASQGNDFRVIWGETLTCYSQNMDTGEIIPGPSSTIVFYLSDNEASIAPEACLAFLRSNWEGLQNRFKITEEEFLSALDHHILSIANARIEQVRTWLEKNTAGFAQDADVQTLFRVFSDLAKELKSHVALCGVACRSCSLSCLKGRQHDDAHDCYTTHKCPHACDDQHDGLPVPACDIP